MSNQNIDHSTLANGHTPASRREIRLNNSTGMLPPLNGSLPIEYEPQIGSSSFSFEELVQSLHELFEHDRQIASQSDATRCGVCYLHFMISELHYREEGFYICPNCSKKLGSQNLSMLRKQQKI